MRLVKTFVVSLVVFLFSVFAHGQTATGSINGTVTDASGAVVSGATVKLTNQKTQVSSQTATDSSGYYIFVNVQPGPYTMRVEKTGFKAAEFKQFDLGVSETLVQNVSVSVGTLSETVEVTTEAALIDASTSELGTVIPEKIVNDLPLNGRNFTQLLTLTPGVTPVSTSQNRNAGCCEGNVGIPNSGFNDGSFHGQNNRSKLYFYDGVINTNIRGPTYIVIPNIDLIQEFKVVGHDAKAEYGGASGGVVNMVSKPGGKDFHGSAFEYVRNNFFDARNTFADGPGTCTVARCRPGQTVPSGPPAFRQNQFGAAVTGPIFKKKTFFSAGYDGWRYSQPDQNLSYVPTAAELNGDFTGSPSAISARRLYNPWSPGPSREEFLCDATGNPLPVNAQNRQSQVAGGVGCRKLPAALINPAMKAFFSAYAATPNIPLTGAVNFVRDRATINNANSYTARVDHHFSDSDHVFFRYTEQRNTLFTPIGTSGSTGGGSQGRNYGGEWVHLFTPTLILNVRAGYAGRPGVDAGQQNTHSAGLAPLSQAGFLDVDKYNGLLVRLDTNQWTAGGNNDFGIRGAADRENPNWSLTPSISWLKGRHNLKAGFWYIEAKRVQKNNFQRYTFANTQTSRPSDTTSGNSMASALLGFPSTFEAQLPVAHGGQVAFKYGSWSAYIQDEWKVTPRFTLTYGLRYDYVMQPETLDGRLWNSLDLANQRYIIGADSMPPLCSAAATAPCIPDAFLADPHANSIVLAGKKFFAPPPIKDNWGPRVGFAWQFWNNTVLRGGYGLYWDALTARSQYAQNDLEAMVWPDAVAFSGSANPCSATNCPNTPQNIIQLQGTGFAVPKPTYSGATSSLPWTGFPNQGDDPKYKDGYSHQWHVEIQRQLSSTMALSVAYAGSKSGRLPYGAATANAASRAFPAGTPAAPGAGQTCASGLFVDCFRQMPWVAANLTYSRSIGEGHYNALETRFQKRFSDGLSTLVSYTWGKSTDTGSGYFNVENGPGGSSSIQNYYDINSARGQSSYNIPHFLSWATVYEFPFGKGKKWAQTGPAAWILGNWQANYIFQARSGAPFNLIITGDLANLRGGAPGGAPSGYLRPNLLADPFQAGPVPTNADPGCASTISQGGKAADVTLNRLTWINPCAFGIPSGAFGTIGRNAFHGPHVVNMDYSMFKTIPLGEHVHLQMRFEAFNIFNIQNYDTPANANLTVNATATTIVSPSAGTPTFSRITTLAQGTTPRQLQFGLRLQF